MILLHLLFLLGKRSSQLSWFWFTFLENEEVCNGPCYYFAKWWKDASLQLIVRKKTNRMTKLTTLNPHILKGSWRSFECCGTISDNRLQFDENLEALWKRSAVLLLFEGALFFLVWWEHSLCHGSVLQLLVSLWVVCGRMQKIPFWLEGVDHGSASLFSKRLDKDLIVIKGLRIMNTFQDLNIIAQRSVDTLLIQVTLGTHCRLLQLLTYF